jgi:mannose-6-phosphate isomerase-like protein (cupin superfamily)
MPLDETIPGNGWAATNINSMGEGPGFRKVRAEIEVNEMGVNAIILPPRWQTGIHWHDRQEEVYFIHSGELIFEFGECDEPDETVEAGAGSFIRVDAATPRRIRNVTEAEATYVIFGAEGGYVGRDGRAPADDAIGSRGGGPVED